MVKFILQVKSKIANSQVKYPNDFSQIEESLSEHVFEDKKENMIFSIS